ncbi:MAG: prepilin-type N-terminal cleavage/methylation domain-containing protein [Candidatus Eremiobacteraeota bacterium]|nr:prepilin-type N-terminal cleavage/methylation domain-containing protein [Candidatus Eremiobacteraeota bacterium]
MMNRKRLSGAFTLMELLIVMFIISLISGIFIKMIVCSKRTFQAVAHRSGTGLDLMVSAWKISQDVKDSSIKYLCDGSTGNLQAFSFISAHDKTGKYSLKPDGTPNWQKHVVYYINPGTSTLLRKENYVDFAADPTLLKPYRIDELKKEMNSSGRMVAPSIKSVKLAPSAGGENAARLFIETESKNQNGTVDRQSRNFTIFIYD